MKTLKSILLIAITIISLNVFSQTEKVNKSKFSIGITAGPNFSNWYIKGNNSSAELDTRGNFFEHFDGLSLGFIGEYKLNNKLSLKSGLLTSNTIILVKTNGTPYDERHIINRFSVHYINIPFILRYNYFEYEEIKLFVNGGLINKVELYTNSKASYEDNNEEIPETKKSEVADHFDYLLGLNIETGFEYIINSNFSLRFYPSFEMSFLNVTKKDYSGKSYILAGLNLSFIYNL